MLTIIFLLFLVNNYNKRNRFHKFAYFERISTDSFENPDTSALISGENRRKYENVCTVCLCGNLVHLTSKIDAPKERSPPISVTLSLAG